MSRARTHRPVDGEVDAAGRRPPAEHGSTPGQLVAALQRTAGNRAVAGLLAEDRSAQFGRPATSAPPPTLFGRRAPQRYTTTDSALANIASLAGTGAQGAVGGLTGAVTFESSAFTAAVGKALAITKTGTDLDLSAQTYSAGGTVKASGPKASVGNYEVGFLQTVYASSRNFYYQPAGHSPGILARILPTVFDDRKQVSDTCSVLPVRDGDAGKKPWYGMETVTAFDKADPSTKPAAMDDTPSTAQPWTVGAGTSTQELVKTDGQDRFRSWLAVKDKSTDQSIPLNFADWQVDYGTTVTFNSASPAASVVTPTATSGAKVTATGDASGGRWPLHDDPVANDVATIVNSNW